MTAAVAPPAARPSAPTAVECELELLLPDRVRFGGREVSVGPRGYALLAAVIGAGGSAAWSELGLSVWGDPDPPRSSVAPAASRVNTKLADLGYPGQLGVDRGCVRLVTCEGLAVA